MSVQPYVRFFKSNSIDFIRLEDYELYLQSDTTRLYYDFVYPSIENSCYFTKIKQSDGLWFQFRSSYENITGVLVDEDGNETDISDKIINIAELTDDRAQYEVNYITLPATGLFYFKISFVDAIKPLATFQSEWFEVQESFSDSIQIAWKMDSYETYPDGVIWSVAQKIWLEGRISDIIAALEKSNYETANNSLLTTRAVPKKMKILELELIPAYIIERLNIIFGHNEFYINEVRFNSDEGIEESERQGDISLYPLKMNLRLVADAQGNIYEDYTEDKPLIGDPPVFDEVLRTTKLETRTTKLEDRKTTP